MVITSQRKQEGADGGKGEASMGTVLAGEDEYHRDTDGGDGYTIVLNATEPKHGKHGTFYVRYILPL